MNIRKIIKNNEELATAFAEAPADIINKWEIRDFPGNSSLISWL
ncbi:MAG: hypothetical protein UMU04_08320 [Halanaerobiales bacterium]|nr:hypothetical protein [Halanaerobiales bacterium]